MAQEEVKVLEWRINAETSGAQKSLKAISAVSTTEGKKISGTMSKAMKDVTKSTQTAAKKSTQQFKKMSKEAKKTGKSYRALKRHASDMGRGLGEMAEMLGESNTQFGSMINTAAMASMSLSGLIPLLAGMRTGLMSMGMAAGAAAGGVGVIVAGIGALAYSLMSSDKPAKKQAENLNKLSKVHEKLHKNIVKALNENEKFRESINKLNSDIKDITRNIEMEAIEIRFEMSDKGLSEIDRFIKAKKEALIEETREDIQQTFIDKLNKAKEAVIAADENLDTALDNVLSKSASVARNMTGRGAAHSAEDLLFTTPAKDETVVSALEDLANQLATSGDDMDEINDLLDSYVVSDFGARLTEPAKEAIRNYVLLFDDLNLAQEKLKTAMDEDVDLKNDLVARAIQNINDEMKMAKRKLQEEALELEFTPIAEDKPSAAPKPKGKSAEELRLEKIAGLKKELIRIDTDLEKSNMSQGEKELAALQARREELESIRDQRINLATTEDEAFEVEMEHMNAILEVSSQIRLKEKELTEALSKQKTDAHELEMRQLREKNDLVKSGLSDLFNSVGTFGSAMSQVYTNIGSKNAEMIAAMFVLQQASSLANISMTTAENVNKAMGYPPPLNAIAAAAATASGIAQSAAVLSTPAPKMHTGGIAPDERMYTLQKGEGVIDARTTKKIGGEEGLRNLKNGTNRPVIMQPFKHFDRYLSSRQKRTPKKLNFAY